jgi:hypothetical protein
MWKYFRITVEFRAEFRRKQEQFWKTRFQNLYRITRRSTHRFRRYMIDHDHFVC